MTIKTEITFIGHDAISEEDGIVVLFGEDVKGQMRDVSVIHKPIIKDSDHVIEKGDILTIGDNRYDILYVGSLCNETFQKINHITLQFFEVPEEPMENSIYVLPEIYPELTLSTIITFSKE